MGSNSHNNVKFGSLKMWSELAMFFMLQQYFGL